jgi:hypothetical protein
MKKISWGTGIVIGISIFVVAVVIQTFFLMNQKVDLVEENYYEKGLKHQKQIDIQKRTLEYPEQIEFKYDGQFITIIFPESIKGNLVKGEILFYRPSDSNLDMKFPIQLTEQKQVIPVSYFKRGFWRIKLNWSYNTENFYKETEINL